MASTSKSSKLECPVCNGPLFIPVHHCRNGHYVCEDCLERCDSCPICRDPVPVGRARCLMAEEVVREQVHKCPHQGCNKSLKGDEYWEHKMNCVYRTAKFCSILRTHGVAAVGDCNVEMPLKVWIHHLRESHTDEAGIDGVFESCDNWHRRFSSESRETSCCVCWVTGRNSGSGDNEEFAFAVLETTTRLNVHWSPIILGSPAFAARFGCVLKIRPCGNGSTTVWLKAPKILFKGIPLHFPEHEREPWNARNDYGIPVKPLKELAEAGDDGKSYHIEIRLYDKNKQEFCQFTCPGGGHHDNAAAEGNGSGPVSDADVQMP